MNLWKDYHISFEENAGRNAFCINNRFYTYSEFSQYIAGSQQLLKYCLKGAVGCPVGIMCHDSIETFAAIFATWFSGCYIVPLHPLHPALVNHEKITQTGLGLIFNSEENASEGMLGAKYIGNKNQGSNAPITITPGTSRSYVLFTSGSTGKPKGVSINHTNLSAFIEGFRCLYPDLTSDDRFLQTYDLTSDAAFTGYLIPLLLGATVYTISPGSFKYLSIVKILQEKQITWTKFTPSVLNYLRPYFKSMKFESLKHSHFGGEALPLDLAVEWASCIPNAEVSNGYGPTETTITCTIHRTDHERLTKHTYNGIVSIGKPFKGVEIIIVDEDDRIVADGEKGELCIGGPQVMDGYLNMTADESHSFLSITHKGITRRFYRSGDIAFRENDGFLMFCGRKDDQLKINGYRIEPAEIEYAVNQIAGSAKSKAFGFRNNKGTTSIVVFIEQYDQSVESLKENLRSMIPSALMPSKIVPINQFPIKQNGKIDKSTLFEKYKDQIYD
jgi:amino acid adenylation domain-containing protein